MDELKIGAREAVFDLKGQVAPTLDLSASLLHVKPDLVNAFAPGLLASGTIEAQARLQALISAPWTSRNRRRPRLTRGCELERAHEAHPDRGR